MALRAFSKVIFRNAKAAFDGLLQRSEAVAPAARLPKQIQAVAKYKSSNQQVVNKDNYWIRNFAWKTLAADLRRRAGWQLNGIANKGVGAGQRWLLFPAYAFVGLAFSSGQQTNLSAEEVDQELSTTTKHIKSMFGAGLKGSKCSAESGGDECRSGRLIARGKRAAVYKVETSKQENLESSVVEDVGSSQGEDSPTEETPVPEQVAEADQLQTKPGITLQCPETVPADQPSKIAVKFTTSDGRQYDVQLQIAPGSSVPVSVANVSVDGEVSSKEGGVHVETLLQEAMQDSTSRTSTPCREEAQPVEEPLQPYLHLSISELGEVSPMRESSSIEVITDSDLQQFDGEESTFGVIERGANMSFTSLDSDIEIIDDTLELSMNQKDADNPLSEDPIFLDDLQEDPLADLEFINDKEAMSYLNNGHEGSYLVMTYFPYQEEMTSLSLPDTGENLWEMYDELFLNSPKKLLNPDCDGAVTVDSCVNVSMATEDDTVIVHKRDSSNGARLKLNVMPSDDTHTRLPPEPAYSHAGGSGDLLASEYHDALPNTPQADANAIWLNRWPSDRAMEVHPNIARPHFMAASENTTTQARYDCTLEERLSEGLPSVLESVAIFTQITEAVAFLENQGFIYRDLHVCDVMLTGPAKWPHVILLDSGGRIYDMCGPKHLTYRDAVVHWTGDCSAVQPVQSPSLSNAGEDDRRKVIADLARMALAVFGCNRSNSTIEEENNISLPSHIPGVFQQLIKALIQSDAHKKFDARVLCCILHLLLWCPQRYFVPEQPRNSKHQVAQWLCTFAATTWMKRSAMSRDASTVPQQETVRLQLKSNFLSNLDTTIIHNALNYILPNIKK